MIRIGEYQTLTILRSTPPGMFLGDGEGNELLLPNKYVAELMKVGDRVDVFVYLDSEDRPVATTLTPYATVEQFGFMKVKQVNKTGAFLDWGLEKDLLVPFKNQASPMIANRYYLVYVYLDNKTNRIAASSKVNSFLVFDMPEYNTGDEVTLLIAKQNELGYQVIVDNRYKGMVYHNEIFQVLAPGERTKGYVKQVREDGKIDVVLQKGGYSEIEPHAQKILDRLNESGGFLRLTDNSSPEEIALKLQMSKKIFKKTIGSLYRQKIVRLEKEGIYLTGATK